MRTATEARRAVDRDRRVRVIDTLIAIGSNPICNVAIRPLDPINPETRV